MATANTISKSVPVKFGPGTEIEKAIAKLRWTLKLLITPKFYDIIDSKIFQDAAKLDSTLSTICYGALLASELIKLKPKLLKWFPILQKKGLIKLCDLSATELTISQKLKMIASYLSDIRIFNRMWAALPLMSWLLSTYRDILTKSSKDYSNYNKLIDFGQVTSCLLLQVFENIGFVGDHHFTTQSDELSLWFNIWCCKLWALYVVLDLVKVLSAKKLDKIGLIQNLANLPLTVHWSLEDGCLSPLQVGFCGTFSSCLTTLQYWKQVAVEIKKSIR